MKDAMRPAAWLLVAKEKKSVQLEIGAVEKGTVIEPLYACARELDELRSLRRRCELQRLEIRNLKRKQQLCQ